MWKKASGILTAVLSLLPLCGASYFPQKPDDPSLLILSKEKFPALHADGLTDDADTLQAAITQARVNGFVLLIPSGKYLLSKTVAIPPSVRVIGFGDTRPTFLLAPHTPGFDKDAPKYMIWFSGGDGRGGRRGFRNNASQPATAPASAPATSRPAQFSDASPGTFYSAIENIDFDIADGNPAAVAIRSHFAQHGIVAHCDFHTNSGLAGIDAVGNLGDDLHFFGGDYGIISTGTSPSWQYTLVDSSFAGQRIAAIKSHNTGLTLLRDIFNDTPIAIAIDKDQPERLYMQDCFLTNISATALSIGEEDNVRTQINLRSLACTNVPTVATYPSGRTVPSAMPAHYIINTFSYGLTVTNLGDRPTITQAYSPTPLTEKAPPVPTDIYPLNQMSDWGNLKSFGAVGDGKADDLPAFQAAIDHFKTIFIPRGQYRVSDTIHLRPGTILVGLNPITTQITIDDSAPAFMGNGPYKGVIEAPHDGINILQSLGIDSGANSPRAVGVKWLASSSSMIYDVKFLGGHGTSYANGTRLAGPYNSDHTGDSNPNRKWNAEGPSLYVTDGGAGTFINIWTASTFNSAGMLIENTANSGDIYELSSEHHVAHEIIFNHVANWSIYAQQTEEEWGESANCLPVEITDCQNLTFANTILFRVFAMAHPFPTGIQLTNSSNLNFLGIRTYGQSPFNFDASIYDTTTGTSIRAREIASVHVSGNPFSPSAAPSDSPIFAQGATPQKIGDNFFSATHAISSPDGAAYFVDQHENKIYKYADNTLSVLRSDIKEPFVLGLDKSNTLLVLSRTGKALSIPNADATAAPIELTPVPAQPRPGLNALLPADRWWDHEAFFETNARREPLQFLSPDNSLFIPIPQDYDTGRQHNWTSQPIDLFRSTQLNLATEGQPFYVADENTHKTYRFTLQNDGTLTTPILFAQHGEAGLTTDTAGNVYIAEGDLYIYNAAGKQLTALPLPDRPLSLTFCGKDKTTLLITCRHSAYTLKMKVAGE